MPVTTHTMFPLTRKSRKGTFQHGFHLNRFEEEKLDRILRYYRFRYTLVGLMTKLIVEEHQRIELALERRAQAATATE